MSERTLYGHRAVRRGTSPNSAMVRDRVRIRVNNRVRNKYRFHFYARKQLLLSARLSHRNSVCLSVCLSVTRVDQLKTVQDRITKSSPSAAWKTLVSGTVKLFHKFKGVARTRVLNERGGQNLRFWPISRCISLTVRDRA